MFWFDLEKKIIFICRRLIGYKFGEIRIYCFLFILAVFCLSGYVLGESFVL